MVMPDQNNNPPMISVFRLTRSPIMPANGAATA